MLKKIEKYRIKYPKLFLLIITVILAFFLFYQGRNYQPLQNFITSLGYGGIFIAGILYAYGFTAAPASALLLLLAKQYNFIFAGLIAGIGALLSDLLIFYFIRQSFHDEIKKLKTEKIFRTLNKQGKIVFGSGYKLLYPALAGFIIASPLPSEIGIALLASSNISLKRFLVTAFILHTLGIFIILSIGLLI